MAKARGSFLSTISFGVLAALAASCSTTSQKADSSGSGSGTSTTTPSQPAPGAQDPTPTTERQGTGTRCGPKTCAPGEVCCNASCGICTPPGSLCTQQMCDDKAAPTANAEPQGQACAADGDCRLFSDYCTACDCRALSKGEKDPSCSGPGVRCVADPCLKKSVACEKGRCVVKTK